MLQAGDEIGRTQAGNNNAYCLDNEISWLNWELTAAQQDQLDFTRFVIRIFHRHPVLRRRKFFQGRKLRGSEVKDLAWFRPDGQEMTDQDWNTGYAQVLGVRLSGDAIAEVDERGNAIVDDTLLLLLNAYHEPFSFVLPESGEQGHWVLLLDTRVTHPPTPPVSLQAGQTYEMEARSLVLFRRPRIALENEMTLRSAKSSRGGSRSKRV